MEASMNDLKQHLIPLERRTRRCSTVPVMNERIDRLEARVAALETRTS